MSSSEMAVEVEGLQKRFGPVAALRGLDLQVPAGHVLDDDVVKHRPREVSRRPMSETTDDVRMTNAV